jgi:hypothetical protein
VSSCSSILLPHPLTSSSTDDWEVSGVLHERVETKKNAFQISGHIIHVLKY